MNKLYKNNISLSKKKLIQMILEIKIMKKFNKKIKIKKNKIKK